jgi:hypothetical protein
VLTLLIEFTNLKTVFVPLFSWPIWQHTQVLLVGAIPSASSGRALAPGKRTVTAALRVMGLSQTSHFQNYHRGLNRASWSGRKPVGCCWSCWCRPLLPLVPWCGAWTTPWNDSVAHELKLKVPTETRCLPATAISSRPAACAGCTRRCWCAAPGPVRVSGPAVH